MFKNLILLLKDSPYITIESLDTDQWEGMIGLKINCKKLGLILFLFIIPVMLNSSTQSSAHITSDYDHLDNVVFSPETELLDYKSFNVSIEHPFQTIQLTQINDTYIFDPLTIVLQLYNATLNYENSSQFYHPNLDIEIFVSYSTSNLDLITFTNTTIHSFNQTINSPIEIGNETYKVPQRDFTKVDFTTIMNPAKSIPHMDEIEILMDNSTQLDLIRESGLYNINVNIQLQISFDFQFYPNQVFTIVSYVERLKNRPISTDLFHNQVTGYLESNPVTMHIEAYTKDTKRKIYVPVPRDLTSHYLNNTLRTHYNTSDPETFEPKELPVPKIKMKFNLIVSELTRSSADAINLRFSYISEGGAQTVRKESTTKIEDHVYLIEYLLNYTPGPDHILEFELHNLGSAVDIKVEEVSMVVPPLFYEPQYTDLELVWMFVVTHKYVFIGLGTATVVAKLVEDDDDDEELILEGAAIIIDEHYLAGKKKNSLFIDDSKKLPKDKLETQKEPLDKEKQTPASGNSQNGPIQNDRDNPQRTTLDEQLEKAISEITDKYEKGRSLKENDSKSVSTPLFPKESREELRSAIREIEDYIKKNDSNELGSKIKELNDRTEPKKNYQPEPRTSQFEIDRSIHDRSNIDKIDTRRNVRNDRSVLSSHQPNKIVEDDSGIHKIKSSLQDNNDKRFSTKQTPPRFHNQTRHPRKYAIEDDRLQRDRLQHYQKKQEIKNDIRKNQYQNHHDLIESANQSEKSKYLRSKLKDYHKYNQRKIPKLDRIKNFLRWISDRNFLRRSSNRYTELTAIEKTKTEEQVELLKRKPMGLSTENRALDDLIEKLIKESQFSWDDPAGEQHLSGFSWSSPQGKHIPEANVIDLAWEFMVEGVNLDNISQILGIDYGYLYHLLSNMMKLNALINSSVQSQDPKISKEFVEGAIRSKILQNLRESLKEAGEYDKEQIDLIVDTAREFLKLQASKPDGTDSVAAEDDQTSDVGKMEDKKEVEDSESIDTDIAFAPFETLFDQDPNEVLQYVNKVIEKKEDLGLDVELDLELKSLLEEETFVAGSFHRDLLYDINGNPNDPREVFELLARLVYYRKNDVVETKVSRFELNGLKKAYGFEFDPESFDSLEFYYDNPGSWLKIDGADNGYRLDAEVKEQLGKVYDFKTGSVRKGKEEEFDELIFRLRAEALDEYFITLEKELEKVLDPVHDKKLIDKLFGRDYQIGKVDPSKYKVQVQGKKKSGSIFGDTRDKFHKVKIMNQEFLSNRSLKTLLPEFTELEDALTAIQRHKELVEEYLKVHGLKESDIYSYLENFEKESLIISDGRHGYDHLVTYRLPIVGESGNLDVETKGRSIIFAPGESKSGIDLTSLDTRFTGKTNTAAAGGPLDEWTKLKQFPKFLMLIAAKKPSSTNSELVEYAEEYHMRLKESFRTVGLTGKVNDLVAEILDGKNSPAGMIYQSNVGVTIVKPIFLKTLHEIISNPGSKKLPINILNLKIPTLDNKDFISNHDEFLEVFDPANDKFRIYPQELYTVKNHIWTSNYDVYMKNFPNTNVSKRIPKSSIDGLSSAVNLSDTIVLDNAVSYQVKVIENKKEVIKNLTIRVLRVDLNLEPNTSGDIAVNLIDEYERYAKIIEEHLRKGEDEAIVLLHLGSLTKNIYHDAVGSLSRRLRTLENDSNESDVWVLDFTSNGKRYELKTKFPKQYNSMNNEHKNNSVNRYAAGQKLLMMLTGDAQNEYYFFGAYRNGENITDTSIINRLAMKGSNIQPRNTINTFWSARGENHTKVDEWLSNHQNDPSISTQFFIQTKKGVKFDLIELRAFLETLKSKYDYLDADLIEYFLEVFDLSAKKNSDGTWDRAADLVQWFKKYVKSEGRKYSLPSKYKAEDGSKIIRAKDFLDMSLGERDSNEIFKHLENWFKFNPSSRKKRRKVFPVSSNKAKSWKKGELFAYAKPFYNLIDPEKIIEIQNFSSRLTGDALENFNEKNYEIVDDVWKKLEPIFKEILNQITGGSKLN